MKDIRTLRLEAGISFGDLARRASVDETELRKVERGLDLPDSSFLSAVARVLGVSAASLRRAQLALLETATPGEGYLTARPGCSFVRRRRERLRSGTIPVLDLFCGTGGFSHGFEQTGSFQVVAGIDLLPDRVETFFANHPTADAICGDITSVSVADLGGSPKPEVVIGGPPCQGFSSIRPFRTLTERDPRNNLFEHFALVVDALRPSWFVLENVVGLLTHQSGQTLGALLTVFKGAGYSVSWRVINAALYGLPQRRERLVVVGSRDGVEFRWPEPTHFLNGAKSMAGRFGQQQEFGTLWGPTSLRRANTVMDAIHDLPPLRAGEHASHYRDDVEPTEYERSLRDDSGVVTLHEATQHSEKMLRIIRHSGFNKFALPPGMVSSGFSTCYSRLEPDLPSVTLTVNFVHPSSNKCIHPHQDRALTPREGARLQGFPDRFRFVGTRAQVVKQIGNAVPPLLGRVIAESLARHVS